MVAHGKWVSTSSIVKDTGINRKTVSLFFKRLSNNIKDVQKNPRKRGMHRIRPGSRFLRTLESMFMILARDRHIRLDGKVYWLWYRNSEPIRYVHCYKKGREEHETWVYKSDYEEHFSPRSRKRRGKLA